MSLQVQSSQPPTTPTPSGRRTPQVYQNSYGGTTTPPPTNGNKSSSVANTTASSKLSLTKSSPSVKQSPTVVPPESPQVTKEAASKESPKINVAVALTKFSSEDVSGSPKAADKEAGEKVTNGSSNGSHAEDKSNGKPEQVTLDSSKKDSEEKDKKGKESKPNTPSKKEESITVEQIKTPESAGKKGKESPVPVTPEQRKKPVEKSLIVEKTFKGFTAEGDEMESLVAEPVEYEDSPMPPRTGGKTKLLKYSGAPPTRARISPFRVKELTVENASTIANLSTVSEGQSSAPHSAEASPALDFNRPLRSISGRRATRPISDIKFTYRKSVELDDSISSLNVTVGSEIHNDSLRTPAPGSSRKRKAMTPESTSDALDVKDIIDSPKRSRLDFSGFLGIVASPVTMLKNRLSRVKLHASTPVAKRSLDEDDLTRCVTAEATTTTANISGEGADKMEVEIPAESDLKKAVEDVEKVETKSISKDGQNELPDAAEEAKEDGSDPVEIKDVTNKQRQFCAVM